MQLYIEVISGTPCKKKPRQAPQTLRALNLYRFKSPGNDKGMHFRFLRDRMHSGLAPFCMR